MSENEWMSMSEEEAIAATIQCINLKGEDTLPCILCPGDGMGDGYCQAAWNITVNALKDIQKYRNMEKRLAEHYGECDRLLEVVVDGLCKHTDIDIGTPIKSRLLTDEDVDKWETYKSIGTVEQVQNQKYNLDIAYKIINEYESIGTVEELREAKEKQNPKKVLPLTYKPLLESGWRYKCPNCGCAVGENIYHMDVTKDYEYCSMCGQKIE